MKRFPLWITGEIALHELATIFRNAGFHLHCDTKGQMCVDRVPEFLRKDEAANVVTLAKKRKRA